jgi:hypothetical protein
VDQPGVRHTILIVCLTLRSVAFSLGRIATKSHGA